MAATSASPGTGASQARAHRVVAGTAGIVALAAALPPLRSSLGLQGALFFLLLGVICVAMIGGARAAMVASATGPLSADFFFAPPYDSLRMAQPANVVAIVVFFAVAAIVSALIDRLARRSMQVSRAQGDAEALAALTGEAVLSGGDALVDLVAQARRTFDLDGVEVLQPDGDAWRTIAAAGGPVAPPSEKAAF
jgi:two-component system, OmpR family, sensor histidine kinase KdpD